MGTEAEDEELRSEHLKTVYAHFGVAIYLSQCLEHSIVNALVSCDLVPKNARTVKSREEWVSLFDTFMSRHFAAPLGRMIGSLKKIVLVPEELENILAKALERRNWLAHAYFRERATDIMSTQGRDKMIAELEEAQETFITTDKLLEFVVAPIRLKHGITNEMLDKAYADMLSEIKDDI